MPIPKRARALWLDAGVALLSVGVCAVVFGGCDDPETCRVVTTAGGRHLLRCPDGSEVDLDGADGGGAALLRVDPEPPGAACPNGGTTIHAGLDLDHDGVLDDAEITSTEHLCNGPGVLSGIVAGDWVVTTAEDAAQLAGVTRILGSLTVETPALTAVSLPLLERIDGDLIVWRSPKLVAIDLPALARVDGVTQLSQLPQLASVAGFGALARIGGALAVTEAPLLTDLHGFDALTTVGHGDGAGMLGGVDLHDDAALTSLDGLGALATVGGAVVVRGCPALQRVDALAALEEATALTVAQLPSLGALTGLAGLLVLPDGLSVLDDDALTSLTGLSVTKIGDLHVVGNAALTSLAGLDGLAEVGTVELSDDAVLASLAALGGVGTATGLFLDRLPALTSLAGLGGITTLPADLVVTFDDALLSLDGLAGLTSARSLTVTGNDALDALGLAGLSSLSLSLTITDNTALRQCRADALLAQLGAAPPMVSMSGNTGAGTCP